MKPLNLTIDEELIMSEFMKVVKNVTNSLNLLLSTLLNKNNNISEKVAVVTDILNSEYKLEFITSTSKAKIKKWNKRQLKKNYKINVRKSLKRTHSHIQLYLDTGIVTEHLNKFLSIIPKTSNAIERGLVTYQLYLNKINKLDWLDTDWLKKLERRS